MSTKITSYKKRSMTQQVLRYSYFAGPYLGACCAMVEAYPLLIAITMFALSGTVARLNNWAEWEKIEEREE